MEKRFVSPETALLILKIFAVWLVLAATDLSLPSLPFIGQHFGVSDDTSQLVIAFYLLGLSISPLFYGPLSDHFGRRRIMIIGFAIFALGSCLCVFPPNVEFLFTTRFSQGLGAGVVSVVGWSAINDYYKDTQAARMMSWLGSAISVAPAIAPMIGGALQAHYNWRMNFIVLAVLSVLLLILKYFFFPETLTPTKRSELSIKKIVLTYSNLLRHKPFITYAILFPLFFAGEWCYLTIMPFYLQKAMHLTADQCGYFIGAIASTYIFATALSSPSITRFGVDWTIRFGIILSFSAGLLQAVIFLTLPNELMLIALAQVLYFIGGTFLFGPSSSKALQSVDMARGTAAAIRSMMVFLFASIGSFVGSFVADITLIPIACFMMGVAVVMFLIHQFLCPRTS